MTMLAPEMHQQPYNATANQVMYGPLLEAGEISAGLDYYKLTMSQLAFEKEPYTEATFTFHNRGEQRLLDYVDPATLQDRFDWLRHRGFQPDELAFFANLHHESGERVFSDEYLDYLKNHDLPPVNISVSDETGDLAIETTGPWALATFWETIVMSEINEAYFEGYLIQNGLDPLEVYAEGDRRLSEKIAILKQHPEIKFADFGTRRHFSLRWQRHVLERVRQECPENLVGTSNVGLARSGELKPIGTFAHEMPMGYAALADARGQDVRGSQKKFLDDWFQRYGEDYSIVLPDTFTTEFFFSDFTPEQALAWKGSRHDSGSPFDYGDRVIQMYEKTRIDPENKLIVFSDALDMQTMLELSSYFRNRIGNMFGWGTNYTNDLGIQALNIVMKLTRVREADGRTAQAVKLSDNPKKHTGPQSLVQKYKDEHFAVN